MENSTGGALSSEAVTALSVVSAVASLIGSVGNLLVLLAVFKNDNIRTIPDFFITSLAFSDFTVCAVFLPLSIYQFHQPQNTGQQKDLSSLARSFLGQVSMVASATNMFAVTIDRVIAIGFPFKYVASVTKQKAAVTIAVVWMISIALGALLIGELISIYVIAIYSAVLLLNTIVMYIYIFVKAKRQENRIQEMTIRMPGVSAEKKVAKTIFTVVGIYAVCWLPTLLLPAFVNPSSEQFQQSFPWVMTLLASNSALNPFIYCLKSQKYRLAFSKILRRTSLT
ncbi:probable G-protein coupled receptor No18 [Acropora millepora]|uniref:probable G-protein coupled receptor No18 n=1 Tax=Acropora millepora TaxID=45264 RepID=UPI001CF1F165|nr:probable G-protein coupled receptor No18 [Acropora millepora]